ncbi:MAG TPA: DUF892 family protein [Bacteroidia bacterium]
MKKISNLRDLLVEQLHSLYETETNLKKSIHRFIDYSDSIQLGRRLNRYAEKTKDKIARLEEIFSILNEDRAGHGNDSLDKAMENTKRTIKQIADRSVRDAAILAKMQRMNHLLICEYGTACAFARTLDQQEVARLLHESMFLEKETDNELSELAKEEINYKAAKEESFVFI